jgi:diadenosine tetraphosphate (Ap4A) HIT family hydrolase
MSEPEGEITPVAYCPFCQRDTLEIVLEETSHFYLLVDHAPLTEGHLLIVPQHHYACYGAMPAELDDELLDLKRRVQAFLTARYGPHVYFEHGVFRQTVFHAHLHAIPIGSAHLRIDALAGEDACAVHTQDDLRTWYAARGYYFYLERPASIEGTRGEALIFPPEMQRYWEVLASLRDAAVRREEWLPQAARRVVGQPKMRSVADAWRQGRS